jgi:hypothetical protein
MWEASLNETLMPVSFLNRLHQTVRESFPWATISHAAGWIQYVIS